MLEFMQDIRKKVYCGIVSGSDLDNVNQQLRGNGELCVYVLFKGVI